MGRLSRRRVVPARGSGAAPRVPSRRHLRAMLYRSCLLGHHDLRGSRSATVIGGLAESARKPFGSQGAKLPSRTVAVGRGTLGGSRFWGGMPRLNEICRGRGPGNTPDRLLAADRALHGLAGRARQRSLGRDVNLARDADEISVSLRPRAPPPRPWRLLSSARASTAIRISSRRFGRVISIS